MHHMMYCCGGRGEKHACTTGSFGVLRMMGTYLETVLNCDRCRRHGHVYLHYTALGMLIAITLHHWDPRVTYE